ncbi:hypothetical protein [Rhodococcus globerulus]|uniref:Uncharacterized protein n=1 Tax=Rhodococcus globerulus TaxID=33008 RepID=A0ABU4C4G6_RHOGO|nr:hypothetical protein [Rhodococcus globerulus]MDV6271382.1 hypothetical protein [Rhodococcus globerulus]
MELEGATLALCRGIASDGACGDGSSAEWLTTQLPAGSVHPGLKVFALVTDSVTFRGGARIEVDAADLYSTDRAAGERIGGSESGSRYGASFLRR